MLPSFEAVERVGPAMVATGRRRVVFLGRGWVVELPGHNFRYVVA